LQLSDLVLGLGLLMIAEGLPLFVSPTRYRRLLAQMQEVPDQALRVAGFVAMSLGLVLLYAMR
jgi:uncharacterized protein YjeT (DUF2065 family)